MNSMSIHDINQYMNANPHLITAIIDRRSSSMEGAYDFLQSFISTNCDLPRGKMPLATTIEEAIEDLNKLGYFECWTVETCSDWCIAGAACTKIKDGLLGASERLSRWTFRIVEQQSSPMKAPSPSHIVFGFINEREATFAKMFD